MKPSKSKRSRLRLWLDNEDGSITVDWVVLTASVVLLGAATGLAVGNATMGNSSDIKTYMEDIEPGTL